MSTSEMKKWKSLNLVSLNIIVHHKESNGTATLVFKAEQNWERRMLSIETVLTGTPIKKSKNIPKL